MVKFSDILCNTHNKKFPVVSITPISSWPLKRKLFSYMLILFCLLILFLIAALFIGDQFSSVETATYDSLNMQLKIFEKDIVSCLDHIAADGIKLSISITKSVDDFLDEKNMSFEDFTDNPSAISDLQTILLEKLVLELQQDDRSGVYVMLDATVNSGLDNSKSSRSGLYLQTNGYKSSYNPVVLLRGNSDIGRANNIVPHRQWRLEFNTDNIPGYNDIISGKISAITEAYRFTELFTIPGTETNVMMLCVPMIGSNGKYYGICGYEISGNYFTANYAQPSNIDNMTYIFAPCMDGFLDTSKGFSCGIYDGYYREPQGILKIEQNRNNILYTFSGDDISYTGLSKSIKISPNNPDFTLSVMMRKSDYDSALTNQKLKTLVIWGLFICVAVMCCHFFSRHFIIPILKSLEQLKSRNIPETGCDIPEIADLFEFLAKNDREHEETVNELETKKHAAEAEKESLMQEFDRMHKEYLRLQSELSEANLEKRPAQTEFNKAQIEFERLAYVHQVEIDPDSYVQFIDGLQMLTATERKIFNYYLDGMGIKEIAAATSVKESTIYTHNRNIYSKLGINSLKQLLRYSALYYEQEKEKAAAAQSSNGQ